jgi:FkbM family methyltransferase
MKKINRLLNQLIASDSILYYYLIKIYYRWKPEFIDINEVLLNYDKIKGDVFFIQIGANEGKMDDPIYHFVTEKGWKGVLIEPVKFIFDKLVRNYNNYSSQLFFENVAISRTEGKQMFYYLRKKEGFDIPFWAEELGSFNKDVILKHKMYIPQIEELIIEEDVPITTISALQLKYNISEPDLLMIDTEGYDFEIIKSYPFSICKPPVLIYENKHLGNICHKQSLVFLRNWGYKLFAFEGDTLAVQENYLAKNPNLVKGVTRKFERQRVIKMLRFNNSH